MQVHDITARLAKAALSSDPMSAVRAELEAFKWNLDAVSRALSYIPGIGGNALQAFYRTPELSLLKVSFPAGRRTPPHDHGTWASILVFSGLEKNTLYRDDGSGLRRASQVDLSRGSILPLREDTVHVAECVGDEPATGLHVYGADVLATTRHMWDPETLEKQPLEWSRYEQLAQRASRLSAAP